MVADRAEVRSEFTLLRIDRLDEPPELRLFVFIVFPTVRVAIEVLALNHPVLAIVRCMDASRDARVDFGETSRQVTVLYPAFGAGLCVRWP